MGWERRRERGGNGGSPVFVTTANDNFSPYIALTSQFPITRVLDSVSLFTPHRVGTCDLLSSFHFQTISSTSTFHPTTSLFHFFHFLSQVRSLSSLHFQTISFLSLLFYIFFFLLMHISHLIHVSQLENGVFIQS